MTRAARAIVSTATLLLSATALAGGGPYIELTVSAEQTTSVPISRVLAHWVFDASAPPVGSDLTRIFFEPVSSDLSISSAAAPNVFPGETVSSSDMLGSYSASLIVFRLTQSYRLVIETNRAGGAKIIEVNIDALPAFVPPIDSLPDDPTDYRPLNTMDAFYDDGTLDDFMAWNHELGFFNGTILFRAREVPAPGVAPGCNVADLAPPYGVHDFDDVLAYLTAFGAGCP